MERENAWEKYSTKDIKNVFAFADNYRKFISECKTERECTEQLVAEALAAGFQDIQELIAKGGKLKPGDRVYANNMGKAVTLFVIGKKPLEKGMNILGAHIDSPRMDLKQNPMYEDTQMAMLDTH